MVSPTWPVDSQALRPPHRLFVVGVATVLIIRIAWSIGAWDPGISALFADDFDRVGLALAWKEDPFFLPESIVWLPFHSWVLGFLYVITGSLFSSDPMALAALLNVAAILGTAAVVGWTAWMIFRSLGGAFVAGVVLVFSPWATFTSLSGLSEPLYYLTLAATGAAYVAWVKSGSLLTLYAGGVLALVATTARYEGWWLAVAWGALVGWGLMRSGNLSRRTIPALVLPGIFPVTWLIAGQVKHGDPLYVSSLVKDATSRMEHGWVLTYYPRALIDAAPVILPLALVVVVVLRRNQLARALATLIGLSFLLFYVGSLLASGRGWPAERIVFAFVVGLAPLLGGVVVLLQSLQPKWLRIGIAGALVLVVGVTFATRTMNDPQVEEWGPPEDLIASVRWIGESYSGEPIRLAAQRGHFFTSLLGDRVTLTEDDSSAAVQAARMPLPSLREGSSIGIWGVSGLDNEPAPEPCVGCRGWWFTDESGETIPLPASPFLPLRFGEDNPLPGEVATIWRTVSQTSRSQTGHIELRAINGHGAQTGNIFIEVRVDGEPIFEDDIRNENRWYSPHFSIPAGTGTSIVEVSLEAQPGIGRRGNWGRSHTLVRALELDD